MRGRKSTNLGHSNGQTARVKADWLDERPTSNGADRERVEPAHLGGRWFGADGPPSPPPSPRDLQRCLKVRPVGSGLRSAPGTASVYKMRLRADPHRSQITDYRGEGDAHQHPVELEGSSSRVVLVQLVQGECMVTLPCAPPLSRGSDGAACGWGPGCCASLHLSRRRRAPHLRPRPSRPAAGLAGRRGPTGASIPRMAMPSARAPAVAPPPQMSRARSPPIPTRS